MDKYFGAPNEITDWIISCGVDKGSIVDNYPSYIFKTSKNYCRSGTYRQRAEIYTRKALSLSTKAKYNFQSIFSIVDNKEDFVEKFNIFSIHDGRNGCAPPLLVNIQPHGQVRLYSSYITSQNKCENDVIKTRGHKRTTIKRDGTEYKLNLLLNFNGKGGFDVDVYLNDKLIVIGEYSPPRSNKYIQSKHFYFKHGVYSKYMFDYEMKSKISMKKVK